MMPKITDPMRATPEFLSVDADPLGLGLPVGPDIVEEDDLDFVESGTLTFPVGAVGRVVVTVVAGVVTPFPRSATSMFLSKMMLWKEKGPGAQEVKLSSVGSDENAYV
jgi:hypothetical protein